MISNGKSSASLRSPTGAHSQDYGTQRGFKSVDWLKYFEEFSDIHGGNPVIYGHDRDRGSGGYLLFSDGWMYSRSNPSGPEYPPDSEVDALSKIRSYWQVRLMVTRRAYRTAKLSLVDLVQTQMNRSASIQMSQKVLIESDDDDEAPKVKTEVGPVNFETELHALRELWEGVELCKRNLANVRVPEQAVPYSFSPAGILATIDSIENGEEL